MMESIRGRSIRSTIQYPRHRIGRAGSAVLGFPGNLVHTMDVCRKTSSECGWLWILPCRQGECDVASRGRRWVHSAGREAAAHRERIASGHGQKHVLVAVYFIDGGHTQRTVGQVLGGDQLSRVLVERVELRVVAGE